ncbi:N-lysine methyltransferase KMT5A-A isoform X2 [Anguilla rostrata]|uniref:N-lysine methyltransferase KMT5A-A isoform X2 n=1 Tax=Anguilla rostrata TaxID=7938 RepID=UPI0030D4CE57
MPQGKNAVPTATKSKPEDATCTEEKGIKEHKPEMNGDVACSRQPASPNFKSLDKQHSPHHDENHGKRTAHGDKMMYGKAVRLNIMNSDGGLPRGAEGRLGPSCVPGEQGRQPRCTEAYLRGPADPTADSNGTSRVRGHKRQTCCRKAKVTKSTLRTAEYRNSQNRKLTEFYPIRRSSRKCNAELKCEEKKHIDELLSSGTEEGMKLNVYGPNDHLRETPNRCSTSRGKEGGFSPPEVSGKGSLSWNTMGTYCRSQMPRREKLNTHKTLLRAAICTTSSIRAKRTVWTPLENPNAWGG